MCQELKRRGGQKRKNLASNFALDNVQGFLALLRLYTKFMGGWINEERVEYFHILFLIFYLSIFILFLIYLLPFFKCIFYPNQQQQEKKLLFFSINKFSFTLLI